MKWELVFFGLIALVIALVALAGCIGVDPSASQGDVTMPTALTAETIETAVQTAINSNASIVNDMWPVVAMCFIAVAGLVTFMVLTKRQTQEIREHVEKCNGHS